MKEKILYLVIAIILASGSAQAQNRTIYGTVSDSTNGMPLPGVSIKLKGAQGGAISDVNGNYSIEIVGSGNILVFSMIGMITREIALPQGNRLDVGMDQEIGQLDEVIVTGSRGGARLRNIGQALGISDRQYTSPAPPSVVYPDQYNTESYSRVEETGYRNVLTNPLSTFSIDVDNAAYSNARRYINSGVLPPADAVRIEEFLNYFNYNYPQPSTAHPYTLYTELSACPWNPQAQLLHVALKGREVEKENIPPSNLVFLIDVSGSMGGANRLPLAKTAMKMLLEELRPQDRVSIVVYASRSEVVLESTRAIHKQKIAEAINALTAGGSTAGGQALRMAYDLAERSFIDGGNNRIVMCTDGDFNVGESSNAAMERLVEEKRQKGIFITVLGFGMGNYKDDRLEIKANKGNGNYGYIDNIQEARKLLVGEFAGTMFTIARDVKLQIEFNPARVKAYRLIGYENRRLNNEDFNNDAKDAGEMGAGHSVTALYEIIPAGSEFYPFPLDPLRYQESPWQVNPDASTELLTIKTRYKTAHSNESILFDLPVRGTPVPFNRASDDFRFAASVASFGLLLLNSPFKGNISYDDIIKMASGARGDDAAGYRAEFINIVRTCRELDKVTVQR